MAALTEQPPAFEADVPGELPDRAADAWEPLLAIADAAGEGWPVRARRAAIVLHASREQDDSLGLRLLADCRRVFDARGTERIATIDLIADLKADEEGPWLNERSPLTAHRLARLLSPFEITSKQIRIGPASLKGYERAAFLESWERYLAAPPSPVESKHRNIDHERSFDVSDRTPSEGDLDPDVVDLPVEQDYPQSAWDPNAGDDDPEDRPSTPVGGRDGGAA